jgi:hypothetical protein
LIDKITGDVDVAIIKSKKESQCEKRSQLKKQLFVLNEKS